MKTRRSFLRELSLAAAGSVLLPPFYARADDKTGRRPKIVGSGDYTYECVHDWLTPPEGLLWGNTHALCQDSAGLIYVGHTVHPSSRRGETVVVYDGEGRFVRAFGDAFRGGEHGLDFRREPEGEFLYHCDISHKLTAKTTLSGEVIREHGYPSEDAAYAAAPIKYVPTNTAFAPNGDYFVADGYGSFHVMRYNRDGRFLGEIGSGAPGKKGSPSNPDGQFHNPHGLWVDTRCDPQVLVVADRGNQRLQVFSLEGQHLRTVADPDRLRRPCHFHVQGDVMVCPDLDSQVCLLDRDYRVIVQLGDGRGENGKVGSRRVQSRDQFTPGKFICPHDAIFLPSGDILVSEWLPIGRITLLRRVGA